jgi:membrane-associated phospholipid phosphatase
MYYGYMTNLARFDIKLFYSINQLPHPLWADRLMLWLHYGTRGGLIYLLLLPLFFMPPYRRLARLLLAAGLATFTISDGMLKPLFHRVRPFHLLANIHYVPPAPLSASFPSGEAAVAAAIVTSAILYLPGQRKHWLWLWVIIVAFNRIYLGHHYPSDVLAGIATGCGIAWIVWILLHRPKLNT